MGTAKSVVVEPSGKNPLGSQPLGAVIEMSGNRLVCDFDAVIVGAGFAGLYMLHKLRDMGFSTRVFEAGSGVGGTWYWNRYPGARCDVESMQYSYQFSEELQQEWKWTEKYSPQPEILRYANHVADRFDLRRDIQFDTRVESAIFDEVSETWLIATSDGARVSARFCIMATGCLSAHNRPNFKGLDTFTGNWYHTAQWPHEGVDFTGKRVGVIGTGSSAIQSIPIIAAQAKHLTVFQRTANYSIPAYNAPLDPEYESAVKADYAGFRQRAKQSPPGLALYNKEKALESTEKARQRENETAAEFVRDKIRATVRDPEVAALLSPRNVIGCKRLCVDTGYYETFNRPNVTLVDISEAPIDEITPTGLITNGRAYAFDAIVFAIGFDAMTGALTRIDIRGRGGNPKREVAGWPSGLFGTGHSGFSQSVYHYRPWESVGVDQYAAVD